MRRDTIIGMLTNYDHTDVVTISELYDALKDEQCVYNIDKYCDQRCSTNLIRFCYDPFDGLFINWKEVKKELLKIDEEHKYKKIIK